MDNIVLVYPRTGMECKLCHRVFREITHTHLRFVHNITLNEYIKRFSRDALCSDATRELIRTIGKEKPPFFLGHKHTKKWKQNQGVITSKRNKVDNPMHKKGVAKNHSRIMKKLWANPSSAYNTKEYSEKHSLKLKRMWSSPKHIKAIIDGRNTKPNKAEMRLSHILRRTCPRIFRYNGDFRLGVSLGRRIPDFVNVNGSKQVIELFGAYWHELSEVEQTIQHYKQFGFDCLIIWEKELQKDNETRKRLKDKLLKFTNENEVRANV